MQSFDAFGAGFDSSARRQTNPLQIGLFSFYTSGIKFATELHKCYAFNVFFTTDGADSRHSLAVISNVMKDSRRTCIRRRFFVLLRQSADAGLRMTD